MAFDRTGLYLVTPNVPPGHRVWSYVSLDTLATIDTTGYFGGAFRELALGDVILAKVVTGSIRTPTGYTAAGFGVVNAMTSAAAIDTTDFTAIGTADTD